MKGYFIDPQADIVKECYAVVYVPKKKRTRFPANTVEVFDSESIALNKSDPPNKLFAAKLLGPCRSSEGFTVFYLKQWLTAEDKE